MYAQPDNLKNGLFLKQLYVNSAYMKQKRSLNKEFAHTLPDSWGEFFNTKISSLVRNFWHLHLMYAEHHKAAVTTLNLSSI